jgi:DNA-binding transcriptional LysR family regulator
LNGALEEFRMQNRSVEIELKLIDDWTEESVESVDVGLALGPVRARSAWSKRLGRVRQVICASPQFLSASGDIADIDDLSTQPGLVDEATMPAGSWTFSQGDIYLRCRVSVRHALPTLLEVRQAAIAGLGVACLPAFMCEGPLRTGQLTALLPDLEPLPRDLLLLSPKSAMPKRGPTALRLSLESALEGKAL